MAKREYIDKNEILDKAQDYGEGQNKLILIDPCYVRNAKSITEQDIVKPYLAKILNNIVDDDYLRKNMSCEVWERVEDIVTNILSEDGEEE